MKQRKFTLLTKMAEYLQEVMPVDRFDPDVWTTGGYDYENNCTLLIGECGTKGCIAGWLLTASWMKKYSVGNTGENYINFDGCIVSALSEYGYFDIEKDLVFSDDMTPPSVCDLDIVVTLRQFGTIGMTKNDAVNMLLDLDKLYNGEIDVVYLGHDADIEITLED